MLHKLTKRQTAVLRCIAYGLTAKEAARRLDISPDTVKMHIKNIYMKLGVNNAVHAALIHHGIQIELED